jgi:hypothetical protein
MGVDADWMKNVWVDEQNRIRSTNIHFYGKNDLIGPANHKMHEVYLSLYYAFKSYADIEEYSKHCGIEIYNTNLLSFVNVFDKKSIK